MMFKFLPISNEAPEEAAIAEAISVLHRGGLVIVPAEAVYRLVCDPLSEGTLEALYAVKGRDEEKPDARFMASAAQVKSLATEWN
jgi:tRNA A37 threonylcarbamoyladenosine synthetase subunit TsaC/SUA5/YrdC